VNVKTSQKLRKPLGNFRQENQIEILKMNMLSYRNAAESKITVIRIVCWGNTFTSYALLFHKCCCWLHVETGH